LPPTIDTTRAPEPLDALLTRTIAGDVAAWQILQLRVSPTILKIARGHRSLRSKGFSRDDDALSEVLVSTLERLSDVSFANLQQFVEKQRENGPEAAQSFESWLYGAVNLEVMDFIRRKFGRAPKIDPEAPTQLRLSKRDLHTLAGRFDTPENEHALLRTVGLTRATTAEEVLRHIAAHFSADEVRAIRLYYIDGVGFAELAKELGLASEKEADRLVRKLNARLRYTFAQDERSD
jgi:DNA-directed RNA polymerase specialized sigma24 family protein